MTYSEAKRQLNEFYGAYRCQFPEACEELHDVNADLIVAMDKEHPGKVVFFRWWPARIGDDRIKPYASGERIYNFCANIVLPSDSPNYAEFVKAVEQFRRTKETECVIEAAEKCGGEILLWS